MTTQLTPQQIQAAQQAFNQGGAPAMWQYLAGQGDSYADNAYSIIADPTGLMGQIVTQSWISSGADLSKFPAVAEAYASKYLDLIAQNSNGTLPNGGEIVTAYKAALTENGVPANAAIDSTMAIGIWTTILGMETSRQTGDSPYDRSWIDQATQALRAGTAAFAGEHGYLYDKETGHWFIEVKDLQGNHIRFDNASPDMESRLNWWVRAEKDALCTPTDLDGNGIPDFMDEINAKFDQSQKIVSPIVLDLNGDGLTTTGLNAGTYFDHNANGFAENTGWVNAQDGILVRDLNGNGTIDSGRELFGSETLLANGQHAANGYVALAELDTNQDGQINAQDAAAASLKIWKDTNGDGYSSADELMTLAAAGVQSIATGSTTANQIDANGNTIKQTGTFTKADGSTGTSADIWFKVDNTNTLATDWLPETAAVAALPDLQGYGNVYDLHQAMLRDGTGHLQGLVQQFASETNLAARHAANDAGVAVRRVG